MYSMSYRYYFLVIFLITGIGSVTSQDNKTWTWGPELQVYPTGLLPGLRIEKNLSDKSAINFRVAFQVIDHRDLGVQDDEKGNGYGFSLGYRRYFATSGKGLSLSLRADYWDNRIDWTNESPSTSGTTDILVLQPTALLEYKLQTASPLTITPSLGFGYEWNVKTVGEPTGEGAILLVGIFVGL